MNKDEIKEQSSSYASASSSSAEGSHSKADASSDNSNSGKDQAKSVSSAGSNARAAIEAGRAHALAKKQQEVGQTQAARYAAKNASMSNNSQGPLTGTFEQHGAPAKTGIYAQGGLNPSSWGSSMLSPSRHSDDSALQEAIKNLTLPVDYEDRNIHAIDPDKGASESYLQKAEEFNYGRQLWAYNDTAGALSREYASNEEQLADILDLMTHAQVYYNDARKNDYKFNVNGEEVSAADEWKKLYDELDRRSSWLTDVGQVQDLFTRYQNGDDISLENVDTMTARAQARVDNAYDDEDSAMWQGIIGDLNNMWGSVNRSTAQKLQGHVNDLGTQLTAAKNAVLVAEQSENALNFADVIVSDADRQTIKEKAEEARATTQGIYDQQMAAQAQLDQLNADYRARFMTPEVEAAMQRLSIARLGKAYPEAHGKADAERMRQEDQQLVDDWNSDMGFAQQYYNWQDRITGVSKSFAARTAGSAMNLAAWAADAVTHDNDQLREAQQARDMAARAYLTAATPENKAALDATDAALNQAQNDLATGQTERTGVAVKLEDIADNLDEKSQTEIAKAKENASKWGQFGLDLLSTAMDMGFDALTGGGLKTMFARVAGSGIGEARRKGASSEQQLAYGLAQGAVEALTEKITDGVGLIYGKGITTDVVEKAISRLSSSDAGANFLRILSGAIGEGGEEVLSDLAQPFINWIIDENARDNRTAEIDPSEMLYDFLLGGAMGLLGQGGEVARGQYAAKNAEIRQSDAAILEKAENAEATGEQLTRGELKDLEAAQARQEQRQIKGGLWVNPNGSISTVRKGANRHDTATNVLSDNFESAGYVNSTNADEDFRTATTGAEGPRTDAEADQQSYDQMIEEEAGRQAEAEEARKVEEAREAKRKEDAELEKQARIREQEAEGARRAAQAFQDEQNAQLKAAQEAEKYAQLAHNAREFQAEQDFIQKAQQARQAAEEAERKAEEQLAFAESQSRTIEGQESTPKPAPKADRATASEMALGAQEASTQANTQGNPQPSVKLEGNERGEAVTSEEAKADAKEVVGKLQNAVAQGRLNMKESVSNVKASDFQKVEGQSLVERVGNFFKGLGNKVKSAALGGQEVILDERGVKSDIAHGLGKAKAATFAAVPDVIANGKIIDAQKNWKGRGYDTQVIAGRISIDGKGAYVACVVTSVEENGKNRFYLHEVVDANGDLIYSFDSMNKNAPAANIKTGVAKSGITGVATGDAASIAQNPQVSNSTNSSTVVGNDGTIGAQAQEGSENNGSGLDDSSVHGRGRGVGQENERKSATTGNDGLVSRLVSRSPRFTGETAKADKATWVKAAEAIERAGGKVLAQKELSPTQRYTAKAFKAITGKPMTYYDASGMGDSAQVGSVIHGSPNAGAFVAVNHPRLRRLNGKVVNGPGTASLHESCHLKWADLGSMSRKFFVRSAVRASGISADEFNGIMGSIYRTYGFKYSAQAGVLEQLGVKTAEEWKKLSLPEMISKLRSIPNDIRAGIYEKMYEELANFSICEDARFLNEPGFDKLAKAMQTTAVEAGLFTQKDLDKGLRLASRLDEQAVSDKEVADAFTEIKENAKPISEFDPSVGTSLYEVPYVGEDGDERKELIAIHNCSISSARHILADGGKAMPSIAISKITREHDDFGDVSFILSPDSIDPSKDPHNKVYGGDAYTPTLQGWSGTNSGPHIAGDVYGFADELQRLAGIIAEEYATPMFSGEFTPGAYGDINDNVAGFLKGDFRDQTALKAAYAAEHGYNRDDFYDGYYEGFPIDVLHDVITEFDVSESVDLDLSRLNALRAADSLTPSLNNDEIKSAKEIIGRLLGKPAIEISNGEVASIAEAALDYYFADGSTIVMETVGEKVDEAISDTELRTWLKEKLDKYGVKDVRNGSGLEDQLDYQRRQSPRHRPFLYDFESLDELRSHKDLLSATKEHAVGSEEAYKNARQSREYAIEMIYANTELDEGEAEDALETIAEHQRDFKKDEDYIEFFRNVYSQDGISTETIEAIEHALLANAELPTGYFEAKPDRILPLSEFKAVLIPEHQSRLAEEFKETGVKTFLYASQSNTSTFKTRSEIINEDLREYLFEEPYLDEETQADQQVEAQKSQQVGHTPDRVKQSQDVNRSRTATKGETKAQFENNGETDYISRTNAERSATADHLTDTQVKADTQVQRLLEDDYTWTDDDVVIAQKLMFDMVKAIRDYQLHRSHKMSKEAFKRMTDQYNQLRDKHTRTLSESGQKLQANYMFSTGDKIVMKAAQTFLGFTKDGRFAGASVNAKNAKIYAGIEEAAKRIQKAVDSEDVQGLAKICKDISDIRNVKKMFGPLGGYASEMENRVLDKIANGENAAKNLENLAYGNLNAVCDDVQPYKPLNAAKTIRVMNMLSNLATYGNNLANNFAQGTVNRSRVNQAFSRLAAKPFAALTGQEVLSQTARGKEARQAVRNAKMEALETATLMQMYGITEENGRLELNDRGMFNPNINPFEQTMSLYRFLTGMGVEATDKMQAAGMLKEMELGIDRDIKAGKIEAHTREQRMQEARHEVNRLLYKDDNSTTALVQHIRDFLNKWSIGNDRVGTIGVGDITMAFAKIPANVVRARLSMTPEGALFQVVQYARGVNKAKRMHAEVLAKGIVEAYQERIDAANASLQAAYEMEHGPAKDAAIRKARSELSRLNRQMWTEAQSACRGSVYKNLRTIAGNYNENMMFNEAVERAGYMNAKEMSQFEAAQLSRKIGRAATSAGMMALGSVLRALGALRDFDQEPDDELRKMNSDKGYRGLMFNISAIGRKNHEWKDGDLIIDGEFLEVIAMPLTIGATAAEAAATAQDAKTWSWLKSIAGNGIAKTFEAVGDIPGMADAINMYESLTSAYNNDYDEKTSRLLAGMLQYAANTVPSFFMPNSISQAAAGFDNKVRDVYTADSAWGQAANIFKNKFPGLRNTIPVSVDVWGNERTYGETRLWGAVNKMLLPGDVHVYRKNKYEAEIERLVKAGFSNATPKTTVNSSFEVGDEKYTMTAQEKLDFKAARNTQQRELFEAFIDSDYYKDLSDAERMKVFQSLKTSAERDAKQDMLNGRQLDVEITRDKWETELTDVNDQIQLLAAKQMANNVLDRDAEDMDYAAVDEYLTGAYKALDETQRSLLYSSFSRLDDMYEAKSSYGIGSQMFNTGYDIYKDYMSDEGRARVQGGYKDWEGSQMYTDIANATGANERQMDFFEKKFVLYNNNAVVPEKYNTFVDSGWERETAQSMVKAVADLTPTNGRSTVSYKQRLTAVATTKGLTEAQRWEAFFEYCPSSYTSVIKSMNRYKSNGFSYEKALKAAGKWDA